MLEFGIEIFRLTVWLIILVSVFYPLERFFALTPTKLSRNELGIDICWYFINSLLPTAIIALPISILVNILHTINFYGIYPFIVTWPLYVKLMLALILNDIGAYWVHRWVHNNPFLWNFHAIHHSPQRLDWLVNTRAHPVDMVLIRLGGLIPVYLLGLGSPSSTGIDPVVSLVIILSRFWSFFIHANVSWRFGPLEYVISTPVFHHWHHANDENRNRNFAAIFPVVDKLFGTYFLPKNYPSLYGISENMPKTLIGQILLPFKVTSKRKAN